jgi:hypothetical protein
MLSSCVLCAVLSSKLMLASAAPIRGVPDDKLEDYGGPHIACAASGARVHASKVNDDVCDCADGTDEPGAIDAAKWWGHTFAPPWSTHGSARLQCHRQWTGRLLSPTDKTITS